MVEHPDDLGQVDVQCDGDLPQDADGRVGLRVLVSADRLAFQPRTVGRVLQASAQFALREYSPRADRHHPPMTPPVDSIAPIRSAKPPSGLLTAPR